MNDIIYDHNGPKPTRIPQGYVRDPNDPWILKWRYPLCKSRQIKERVCCKGLKNHIQYCTLLRCQVYNECIRCQQRET